MGIITFISDIDKEEPKANEEGNMRLINPTRFGKVGPYMSERSDTIMRCIRKRSYVIGLHMDSPPPEASR